jgi:hypothetical protein
MKTDWTILLIGIVGAVAAAFIVEWLNRTFHSPTRTANESAWMRTLAGGAACATGCALPNFNLAPENPAFTYQTGAPVTNFRPYQRAGVLLLPACDAYPLEKASF